MLAAIPLLTILPSSWAMNREAKYPFRPFPPLVRPGTPRSTPLPTPSALLEARPYPRPAVISTFLPTPPPHASPTFHMPRRRRTSLDPPLPPHPLAGIHCIRQFNKATHSLLLCWEAPFIPCKPLSFPHCVPTPPRSQTNYHPVFAC